MGRQGKNTQNATKSNMTPIKTSGPKTARLEQPNIDEAEENALPTNQSGVELNKKPRTERT